MAGRVGIRQEPARACIPRLPRQQSRGFSSKLIICCTAAAATAASVDGARPHAGHRHVVHGPTMAASPALYNVKVPAVPPRSPLEVVSGWLRWAGMILFIGVPIWLAQGFVALLGATLG